MLVLCLSQLHFRQCNPLIPKIQILDRYLTLYFLFQPIRIFHSAQHVYACNVRIASLSRAGKVETARQVFDKMPERDVVSWNAMVTGYWRNRYMDESKMLFDLMPTRNVVSWNSMIAGCVENERVEEAFEYFRTMPGRNTASWNAMISGFVRYGRIQEAGGLFDEMPMKNVISYGAMIDGYARNGEIEQARALFDCMPCRNDVAWTVMISGYVENGRFEEARELFDRMPDKDIIATTAMISGHCKEGKMENARILFEEIQLKDCVSFNTMITGYAQNGNGEEALKLHTQMLRMGLQPDHSTIVSVLSACSSLASLEEGKRAHIIILKKGFDSHLAICNALITMYSKCGGIIDSESAFSHLNNPDLVSWNTIIVAFAQHGLYEKVVSFFADMRLSGCEPDGVTFLGLLSACGHSGHLHKAYQMIQEMPFEPDSGIWGALLSACCAYSNAELGQVAAEKYVELDRQNSGAYIMLSNIYAAAGMWKEVKRVRGLMKEKGVKKKPAYSWTEIGNKVHFFLGGDVSHPNIEEIHSQLKNMGVQMKRIEDIAEIYMAWSCYG